MEAVKSVRSGRRWPICGQDIVHGGRPDDDLARRCRTNDLLLDLNMTVAPGIGIHERGDNAHNMGTCQPATLLTPSLSGVG